MFLSDNLLAINVEKVTRHPAPENVISQMRANVRAQFRPFTWRNFPDQKIYSVIVVIADQ
jgi:hypothetical protein